MAGFFPVMMFGLPAACLAMYQCALPDRRRAVGGLLGSIALTSILTGVTEPIEFTFIFLAPALYAVHALLTGVAFIVMNALHVRLGFGFSAGLFDYALNFSRATRPLWLLPVGAAYFALYYGLFRFVIVRFDLKTPGRDRGEATATVLPSTPLPRAAAWIAALGGSANLKSVDACTTRLRLIVASQSVVDSEALQRLGARGLVRPSAEALQVVVGPTADQLAGEIRAALQSRELSSAADASVTRAPAPVGAPLPRTRAITAQVSGETWSGDAAALLAALGGRDNVREVSAAASRLRIGIGDAVRLDRTALGTLGLRGVALPHPGCVHLIVGPGAEAAAAALRHLLNTRLVRSGAP
jgi:N-acetylglucosamine PTS system EIICBA or EIICB component